MVNHLIITSWYNRKQERTNITRAVNISSKVLTHGNMDITVTTVGWKYAPKKLNE